MLRLPYTETGGWNRSAQLTAKLGIHQLDAAQLLVFLAVSTMSSVAALPAINSGDEDLAQLYHQVLAGFAEESPAAEQQQSAHPISPSDRELEHFYGQYQDGEGTPTANRVQSPGRLAPNICASFYCIARPS